MDLEKSKAVQRIAKLTLAELTNIIRPGITEQDISNYAERFMRNLGVSAFWYHGIAALVLVGDRTPLSISGSQYIPSNLRVKSGDLVTVYLSPTYDAHWGDCERSYVVE